MGQKSIPDLLVLLKVIQRVIRRTGVSDPELDAFLAIPLRLPVFIGKR